MIDSNIYNILKNIIMAKESILPQEEKLGKVWVEVYEVMKGMYMKGYLDGCRGLLRSATEEGIVIPDLEDAGILHCAEEEWGKVESKLNIPRIDI